MNTKDSKDALDVILKDAHRYYCREDRCFKYQNYHTGELIDPTTVQLLAHSKTKGKYHFHFEIAMQIIDLVRRGHTVKEISDSEDMPPLEIIRYWENMHPIFKENLNIARQDRAEGYHDNIIAMADMMAKGNADKDQVNANKAAIDAYKWAAEKGNPERYGRKLETKHSGDMQPTVININTGIKRHTDMSLEDIIVKPKKVSKEE